MKFWTKKEHDKLAHLYARFDTKGCAMILGRSYASVKDKIKHLKLSSPRSTGGNTRVFYAQDVANVFELVTMGFSHSDIAKCFNVPARTIQVTISRAKREGLSAYPKRTTKTGE